MSTVSLTLQAKNLNLPISSSIFLSRGQVSNISTILFAYFCSISPSIRKSPFSIFFKGNNPTQPHRLTSF